MVLLRRAWALVPCAARGASAHGCGARWAHKAASTAFYRPLPDISVSWSASDDDVQAAKHSARARHMPFDDAAADELRALHARLAELHRTTRALEREQREVGAQIPALSKAAKAGASAHDALEAARTRARALRTELRTLQQHVDEAQTRSVAIRDAWPNRMHASVPLGPESEARVVALHDARTGCAPLPDVALPCAAAALPEELHAALPTSPAHDHLRRADTLPTGGVDMSAGIVTTGPSWPYLLGTLSMLEHALTQYALATALRHGFVLASVPDVIKTDVAERCGFRPRDEASAQTYFVDTQRDTDDAALCLAGTAEIPLAAFVANRTFASEAADGAGGSVGALPLPVKLVALGHAFRAEAGARGTDTRGLYRIHQFSKVEMFAVTAADASDAMLEELRAIQEEMAQGLGLLYRVLDMPSEELGASAYRKYDVEAWMPGRGGWGEICSASNCTDYQAHRLAIKYRPPPRDGERAKLAYAHTLNATAAAIPRLIVALLETYGHTDGRLVLPAALQPYWLGGAADARVQWAPPRTRPGAAPRGVRALHTAARRGTARAAPAWPVRRLRTSAVRRTSFAQYRDELRAKAAQHGASPASLVLAFAVLHELTAIVPLFFFAVLFTVLGTGESILGALDAVRASVLPDDAQGYVHETLHAWIVRGTRFATRLCTRCSEYVAYPTEGPTSPVAVWLSSLTAAYVVVKLLVPVRLAASFALAPWLARRVLQPLARRHSMATVLVYSGEGAAYAALPHAVESLARVCGQSYDVQMIPGAALAGAPWDAVTQLLVLPDGPSVPAYRAALAPAVPRLEAYVRRGGHVVAVGAAAACLCAAVAGDDAPAGALLPCFGGTYRAVPTEREAVEVRVGDACVPLACVGARVYGVLEGAPAACLARVGDAAVGVACRVGQGSAVLLGVDATRALVPIGLPPGTGRDAARLDTLAHWLAREARLHVAAPCAAPVGPPSLTDPVRLAPLYVVSRSDAMLAAFRGALCASASADTAGAALPGVARVLAERAGSVRVAGVVREADTYTVLDVAHDAAATLAAVHEACWDADYAGYKVDGAVDWARVPKYVAFVGAAAGLVDDAAGAARVAPFFVFSRYFEALVVARLAFRRPGALPWAPGVGPMSVGDVLGYGQVVTSTQTLFERNSALRQAAPSGTTLVATHQVAGRGRGANAWVSPAGCLQFSTRLAWPRAAAAKSVFVQYLAALAIVYGLSEGVEGGAALRGRLKIKWPNDVYGEVPAAAPGSVAVHVDGATRHYRKLGGILVGAHAGADAFDVVVGCGVNVTNARPTTCLAEVAAAAGGAAPALEACAAAILAAFERALGAFAAASYDFGVLVDAYRAAWLHSDQAVDVGGARMRVVGVASDTGLLRTVPAASAVRAADAAAWAPGAVPGAVDVQPDGNSFDMLQGLVRPRHA
ncbi:serine--tRNA ligase [Malassezia brasiliensis]|uniref:serine--tRNA ligase n=1 Tax=Malassezia brasiliensis TaxID=1821822 RepID=A0AAF0DVA7_9BASI|nr:serine--tRNA ligase [Malassezia brasiliensis]